MLLHKRRIKIAEYLKDREAATLDELCSAFNVSKNTIRRDVNDLVGRGIVRKVYGGVILSGEDKVIPLDVRQLEAAEEKGRIGKAAGELVFDGDIIAIDSGSTTVQMVKYLSNKQNLTIITNSFNVITESLGYTNLNIISTGGNLLRGTNSFVGLDSINTINKLNAKTAFISATGVSIDRGLTNSSLLEAEIKKALIRTANKVVLMADSSKFGAASLATFADLKDVDIVITDRGIPEDYVEYFHRNNIELTFVD